MTTLSELLRLQEEATKAPWDACTAEDYTDGPVVLGDGQSIRVGKFYLQADCDFAAAARNFDLKALATQYEAMREWLGKAEHLWSCPRSHDMTQENCTCGLTALRASLDTKARGDGK